MIKDTVMVALLFDFYGDLLTEHQRAFFEYYYNDDLSLSEIAENEGITRQGVREVLLRAENILLDMEQKLGLVERFQNVKKQSEDIIALANGLLSESDEEKTKNTAQAILVMAQSIQLL